MKIFLQILCCLYLFLQNTNIISSQTPQNVTTKPSPPTIVASASSICQNTGVLLSASGCTGGTIVWTDGHRGSSVNVVLISTKTFRAVCRQGNESSDSSASITVLVKPSPSVPTVRSEKKICNTTFSIKWDKTFGGGSKDNLNDLLLTSDGSYILTGNALSGIGAEKSESNRGSLFSDSYDYWVIKVDANGQKVWDKTFGGSDHDFPRKTLQTSDGGFLIAGFSYSDISSEKSQKKLGASDIWLVKIDRDGNKLWDKTIGTNNYDDLGSIISTTDGGFLLGGSTQDPTNGDFDYWAIKIDNKGDILWQKVIGGNKNDKITCLLQLPDGGFILGGYSDSDVINNNIDISSIGKNLRSSATNAKNDKTESCRGDSDYWIVKIDPSGNKLWDKTFGGNDRELPMDMVADDKGNYMLVGYSFSRASGERTRENLGDSDYWLVNFNDLGQLNWEKTIGGNDADRLTKVLLTADGGYLLGGYSQSSKSYDKSVESKGGSDYWIVKINEKGDIIWDKNVGGFNNENLTGMIYTQEGGVLIGGYSLSSGSADKTEFSRGIDDYWIVKLDVCNQFKTALYADGCNGTIIWNNNSTDNPLLLEYNTNTKSYYATCVKDACISKPSDNIVISTNKTPYVSVSSTEVCKDYNVTLTATGCGNYETKWSNGSTGTTLVIKAQTSKSFRAVCVQNGIAGDSSNSVTVKVVDKPSKVSIYASNQSVCQGETVTLTALSCPNGTISWSDGSQGFVIRLVANSTQTFKATCNLNGCIGDESESLTITATTPPLPPMIQTANVTCDAPLLQQWNKTIGGTAEDTFTSMIATTNGYLVGGYSNSLIAADKSQPQKGNFDYWITKLDLKGNKVWDRNYGGKGTERFKSMLATNDGGVLLGGSSNSPFGFEKSQNSRGGMDFWIIKIDAKGSVIWDKTFGGNKDDILTCMIPTFDGGYLLGGYSSSIISSNKTSESKGGNDYWILKIDALGNKLWDSSFGGTNDDFLTEMLVLNDGSFLLGGTSESLTNGNKTALSKGKNDYWIVKISSNGNKIWDKTFGGNDDDILGGLSLANDGGFIIGGYSISTALGDKSVVNKGKSDFWILKTDAVGNIIWDKCLGGNDNDYLRNIKTTKTGYLLAGDSYSNAGFDKSENSKGSSDYWIVKIDETGTKIWDKSYGGDNEEMLTTLLTNESGEVVLGGSSLSDANGDKSDKNKSDKNTSDYWIIRMLFCAFNNNAPTTLTATGCSGTINWSNGMSGNVITVNPNSTTNYSATCTDNGCTSVASNTLAINRSSHTDLTINTVSNNTNGSSHSVNYTLYPNPTLEHLTLSVDKSGQSYFTLYNAIGEKVLESVFEQKATITLHQLNRGVYVYTLQNGSFESNGKLLIE